jgi:AAA ATPase domain
MSTDLVGRAVELEALVEYLDDALAGRQRLILCQGEPGIGKTRLAQELCAIAEKRGFMAAWGTAVDTVGAPPFWPWRQVLRGLHRVTDVVALADESGLTTDLAVLAPELFNRADHGTAGCGPVQPVRRVGPAPAVGSPDPSRRCGTRRRTPG